MGYKIRIDYKYKEYKDNPEATEFSASRGQTLGWIQHTVAILSPVLIIAGFIVPNETIVKRVLYIAGGVVLFVLTYFVFSPWYDKRTEAKVVKLMAQQQIVKRQTIEDEVKRMNAFDKYLKGHDVDELVNLSENYTWRSNEKAIENIGKHSMWKSGLDTGVRIVTVGEKISKIDFANKMIEDAIFSHCIFYKCDLSGASFKNCNLYYSKFIGCKMKDTEFPDSNMEGVVFS